MQHISARELKTHIDNNQALIILDVREPYECQICKIEALHIPMADVNNRIDEIPRDKMVVVLCRSGKRAVAVANILCTENGFKNLLVLEGGILAWIEEVDNQLEAY